MQFEHGKPILRRNVLCFKLKPQPVRRSTLFFHQQISAKQPRSTNARIMFFHSVSGGCRRYWEKCTILPSCRLTWTLKSTRSVEEKGPPRGHAIHVTMLVCGRVLSVRDAQNISSWYFETMAFKRKKTPIQKLSALRFQGHSTSFLADPNTCGCRLRLETDTPRSTIATTHLRRFERLVLLIAACLAACAERPRFNNLFWQTGAGADGTYRWLFRRPAFEVDPEERDVMGGGLGRVAWAG